MRGHLDGRLHPGVLTQPLEGVLEGECVHDGAQHADVVGLGGVHPAQRAGTAPPEIAAADDHGHVDAEILAEIDDVVGGRFKRGAVEALAGLAGQRLTGWFEDDPFPTGPRPSSWMVFGSSLIDSRPY